MIGLYFLGVIAIYVFAWYWIVRWSKPRWAKCVLILVAVAIPTWDLVPQQISYIAACRSDAGERISTDPIKAPGFYYAFTAEESARSFVSELGFEHVEVFAIRPGGKTLVRIDRSPDGSLTSVPIEKPSSRYEYSEFMESRPHNVRAFGLRVVDRETGTVLASNTTVAKGRTWVFRAMFPASWPGDGGACHGNPPQYPRLVPDFLSPITSQHDEGPSK